MPEPLPRTEEKKRWYFLKETVNAPGFAVLSKVFYSYDAEFLYERSGKRTPRESTWRTWHNSEMRAVGRYFTLTGKRIESAKKDLAQKEKLYSALGRRLNELMDADDARIDAEKAAANPPSTTEAGEESGT